MLAPFVRVSSGRATHLPVLDSPRSLAMDMIHGPSSTPAAIRLAISRPTTQTGAMARKIVIKVSGHTLEAELSDSAAGRAISSSLPLAAEMSRWGQEYYGSVGIDVPEDGTARDVMEIGEIAYWPPGRALCIFFGRTPASTDARPKAASPVLPIGRVITGLDNLFQLGKDVKMKFDAV